MTHRILQRVVGSFSYFPNCFALSALKWADKPGERTRWGAAGRNLSLVLCVPPPRTRRPMAGLRSSSGCGTRAAACVRCALLLQPELLQQNSHGTACVRRRHAEDRRQRAASGAPACTQELSSVQAGQRRGRHSPGTGHGVARAVSCAAQAGSRQAGRRPFLSFFPITIAFSLWNGDTQFQHHILDAK